MKKILSILLLSSSLIFADNNSIGLDTVVGATIGVAIGNQIGKGNGKDVARVAGGLLGAAVANNARTPSYDTNKYYDNNYNNNYNNGGYERSTTYIRKYKSLLCIYCEDFFTLIYQKFYIYPNRHLKPLLAFHQIILSFF